MVCHVFRACTTLRRLEVFDCQHISRGGIDRLKVCAWGVGGSMYSNGCVYMFMLYAVCVCVCVHAWVREIA